MCAAQRLARRRRLPPPDLHLPLSSLELSRLAGLGCADKRDNRTLHFVLMDSTRYPKFVQNVGAQAQHPLLLILDSLAEFMHLRRHAFSNSTLCE